MLTLKKHIALILVLVLMLSSCAQVPNTVNKDGIIIATENSAIEGNEQDELIISNDSTPSPTTKTSTNENLECIISSGGKHIELELVAPDENRLYIDAIVEISGITRVGKYNYVLVPVSDELRQNLLTAKFGDRVSEIEYDALNNVWTLSNSSSIGDYFLFNTYYPMAGDTVPGEESFSLENRKVDLYPFDDNLLESVASSAVELPLSEAISLCDQLVDAVTNLEDYTVDYVHAYGTNGRHPYYKIVYKRILDNMPVTSYNDLIFLVDDDGVEKAYGSIFEVEEVKLQTSILSIEAAVAALKSNIARVGFDGEETKSVRKITLEYIVVQNIMGEISVVPAWRFWLGDTEDQMNNNRDKIFAIDATTGELIQGERGNTF